MNLFPAPGFPSVVAQLGAEPEELSQTIYEFDIRETAKKTEEGADLVLGKGF